MALRCLLVLLLLLPDASALAEDVTPFADDLGYPWTSSLPYGATGLYRLTKPRAALDLHRFEAIDVRKSSVSKTTARSYHDVALASAYVPLQGDVTAGIEGFVRRGKSEVRFTADGLEDLNYFYERTIRSTAAVVAYAPLPFLVAGGRYGAYYLEDRADTTELGAFGTEENDKQNFRVFEPALTWHDGAQELTVTHQPKVDRSVGSSTVRAPAVLAAWYLHKPRAPTTLMAGFSYSWYGAFADGEENVPELALGQRRWMEYGDVGLIVRYKAPHHASQEDVQPDNVDVTKVELVSHAATWGDFELGVTVGYGFGSGKGETDARPVSVETEQLDGLVTLAKTF